MRALLFFTVLLTSVCGFAAEPTSFADAWRYLAEPNRSERWVVVSTAQNNGFFQCENLDDVVRCTIPAWEKQLPTRSSRILPVGARKTPYPDIKGAKFKAHLTAAQVDSVKDVLQKMGLDPFLVYSQIQDESGRIVGTLSDIRVMVSMQYKDFEPLAKRYLREVFGITEKDGYVFSTDGSTDD